MVGRYVINEIQKPPLVKNWDVVSGILYPLWKALPEGPAIRAYGP